MLEYFYKTLCWSQPFALEIANIFSHNQIGQTYMVRRSDDTWCLAEVIHRRENQDTVQEEFYVHYENFNRWGHT